MTENVHALEIEIASLAKRQTHRAALKSALGFTILFFLIDVVFKKIIFTTFHQIFAGHDWGKLVSLFVVWLAAYHFLFKREFRKRQVLKTAELASLKTKTGSA